MSSTLQRSSANAVSTDFAKLPRPIGSIKEVLEKYSVPQHPLANAASDDFAEVLEHRAELVSDYILEQRLAALADAKKNPRTRKEIALRYDRAIERFHRLHEDYLEALSANKSQLAHEILGEIHELIYARRHKRFERPPVYFWRGRIGPV